MNNLHVKTGDTAVVLSGKEKGKRGKILSVNPKKGMVVIEGVNMIKCHTKPRRQGETGGIIEREIPSTFADKPQVVLNLLSPNFRTARNVERAINLSKEKYCSASIMLGKTAEITHDFEIVEV